MRESAKQKDRLQIPLMFVFRDAYAKRDSAKDEDQRVDGERVISDRGLLRKRGADESLLKRDLSLDLASLVETVDFASVVDLSDLPYVQKSIVNFGLDDMVHVTVGSEEAEQVGAKLKAALLAHEPRLSPDTLRIERGESSEDDRTQRIQFRISADMLCNPLDVPIEFVAEIDGVSGKLLLPRLPGSA